MILSTQTSAICLVTVMFMLLAKKEVMQWLKEGKKTIDVRKGSCRSTDSTVVFMSGPHKITATITKTVTGKLGEVITETNYRQVIPTAQTLQDAYSYLNEIYGDYDGTYTAYYLDNIAS